MEEIWKDIKGYEGFYQISSFGRVKSFKKNRNGKILKGIKDTCGYFMVCLCKDNLSIRKSIHSLVALNFLEKEKENLEVNHIDENKENNNIENLEWVTHKENINHGTRNKRTSEKLKKMKINVKPFEHYERNSIKRNHFKKKCLLHNEDFKNFIEIDSKEKNFSNKKYFYFRKLV